MAGFIRPQINWREIDTENVIHITEERDLPGYRQRRGKRWTGWRSRGRGPQPSG